MYKKVGLDEFGREINVVLRTTDKTYIPFNVENVDYQEYLKWLEAGNTPLPADGE